MKIGILGTGSVGSSIGSKLIEMGHEVKMGSRTTDNEKALAWVAKAGDKASNGTFADAASFGEILFNCTAGGVSVDALNLAGAENLNGKILVDIANSLDFSKGMPPTLSICNDDSVGETIQRSFPEVKVVKALNTMNAMLMVNPDLIPGDHSLFLCGNDESAKAEVKKILASFGWKDSNMIDLGDISNSRGTEQILPLWIRLYGYYKSPMFNFNMVKA